jgi:hypothetical protein
VGHAVFLHWLEYRECLAGFSFRYLLRSISSFYIRFFGDVVALEVVLLRRRCRADDFAPIVLHLGVT